MPTRFLLAPPFCLVAVLFGAQCSITPDPFAPGNGSPGAAAIRGANATSGNLVTLEDLDTGVVIDLRYARADNVTGMRLYPEGMPCLVNRGTAKKLAAAQRMLRKRGFGLKVWDGYRPPRAHLRLWDSVPRNKYVVPPTEVWSLHCSGSAVDVTLVDLEGRELPMPSGFDEFSNRAATDYQGGDPEVAKNLEELHRAMRRAGFVPINDEWWHFYDPSPSRPRVVFADELGLELPPSIRDLPVPEPRIEIH